MIRKAIAVEVIVLFLSKAYDCTSLSKISSNRSHAC